MDGLCGRRSFVRVGMGETVFRLQPSGRWNRRRGLHTKAVSPSRSAGLCHRSPRHDGCSRRLGTLPRDGHHVPRRRAAGHLACVANEFQSIPTVSNHFQSFPIISNHFQSFPIISNHFWKNRRRLDLRQAIYEGIKGVTGLKSACCTWSGADWPAGLRCDFCPPWAAAGETPALPI